MNAFVQAPPAATTQERSTLPLDAVLEIARSGAVSEALERLVAALAEARARLSPEAWFRAIAEARAHPLREFLHRDPFTLRCYSKPRGYAADAAALDYVLRGRELAVRGTDPVSAIHYFTTHGQLARALRFRRDWLAREIDAAATRAASPLRIFAAGCGHLRECDRIDAFAAGRIGKLVAFDMDADNLEGLRHDYGHLPIVTHQGSVRQLADGKHLFGDMDVVYCAGLIESLPQSAALGLARALFAMLRPGGSLLITCFTGNLSEAGYLETFMDWRMLYRSQSEICGLLKDIPFDAVADWRYVDSPEATLGMLRITRR
jgi:extracellular factor (EF) 3-hydroxypalmitic acid methyl ester biosynthesis protein